MWRMRENGKAVIERLGGRNIRLLAASVAGKATGTLALIEEADDFAAWGALVDKIGADPEGVELISGAAADLVSGYQTAIWVDVPL